jgi:hypothetical protein
MLAITGRAYGSGYEWSGGMRVAGIDGEAKRAIGFGVAELYTFVYKTPVGPVNIQIPREMAVSAPQTVKFRIEWEGDGQEMPPDQDD